MGHFVSYIKILKCNFLTEFSVEVNILIDGKDSCLCGQVDIYALPVFCSGHLSVYAQARLLGDVYFEMR